MNLKIFKIVLAFGNYMNSSKRGPVYGFKLQSLESVRIIDFIQNLEFIKHNNN